MIAWVPLLPFNFIPAFRQYIELSFIIYSFNSFKRTICVLYLFHLFDMIMMIFSFTKIQLSKSQVIVSITCSFLGLVICLLQYTFRLYKLTFQKRMFCILFFVKLCNSAHISNFIKDITTVTEMHREIPNRKST